MNWLACQPMPGWAVWLWCGVACACGLAEVGVIIGDIIAERRRRKGKR